MGVARHADSLSPLPRGPRHLHGGPTVDGWLPHGTKPSTLINALLTPLLSSENRQPPHSALEWFEGELLRQPPLAAKVVLEGCAAHDSCSSCAPLCPATAQREEERRNVKGEKEKKEKKEDRARRAVKSWRGSWWRGKPRAAAARSLLPEEKRKKRAE